MSFVVLVALLINALMFTAIRYMVINRQIRLADTSQFDLANFIRMQEQSREVRSRREPRAPEKPETEQQRDLSRLAEASKGSGFGGLVVDMPSIDIDIDVDTDNKKKKKKNKNKSSVHRVDRMKQSGTDEMLRVLYLVGRLHADFLPRIQTWLSDDGDNGFSPD